MWPFPRIVAHRGGGKLAPENTMAAFRAGLAHGFRAVEFDVMLARDEVPVVMHDPHLGRTVNGIGNVFDYDAAELARMDAGGWFGRAFAGEPVPRLADVVDFCRAQGIWMNIEIKPAPGFEARTGTVVGENLCAMLGPQLAGAAPASLPLLSSFSETALAAARDAAPAIPRGMLFEALPPDWESVARRLGAIAIHCDHKALARAHAQAVRAAGFGLFCYTVNDPARARTLLDWGVEAFCTDRLDLFSPDFC